MSGYGREASPQIFCFKNFHSGSSSSTEPAVKTVPLPAENGGRTCFGKICAQCQDIGGVNEFCFHDSTISLSSTKPRHLSPKSESIANEIQYSSDCRNSASNSSNGSYYNNIKSKSTSQKCERISSGAEVCAGAEQLPPTRKTAVTATLVTCVKIPPSSNSIKFANNNNNNKTSNSVNEYECEGHRESTSRLRRASDNGSVKNLFYLNKKIDTGNTQSYGKDSHKNKLLLIAAGQCDGRHSYNVDDSSNDNARRIGTSGETGSSEASGSKCGIVINRLGLLLDEGNLKCIN